MLSAVVKRDPPLDLIRRLARTPPTEQCTTAITLGELVYGVARRASALSLRHRASRTPPGRAGRVAERMDRERPITRRWATRLWRDLEADAVAASTRMEGVPVTLEDVRQILAGEPPDLREQTQRGLWTMIENVLVDRDLSERTTNALWDAFFGRSVTTGYYRDFTNVSAGTATADLKAATAAGLLTALGATRARRYVAGPALYPVLAEELGMGERPTSRETGRSLIVTELGRRVMPR